MSSVAERPPTATEPRAAGFGASRGTRGQRRREKVAFVLLALAFAGVLVPALATIGFVTVKGLPTVSWRFVSAMPENGMIEGGILPAIYGSALLVALTVLFSLPVGVLGAVYLTEYARAGLLVRIIRIAILNLAGVPSVVYGLFGMGVFVVLIVPAMMDALSFPAEGRSTACLLAGALTMALLVLPMVVTTTEEALRQVPRHYRDSSLALGATKWQTIRRVVLPNALPGILTGVMLSIGRAAGETAPVLLTGAAFYMPSLPRLHEALFKPFSALPYHLYATSTQLPNAPDSLKWGIAFVLLATVLAFNGAGIALRWRMRRRRR